MVAIVKDIDQISVKRMQIIKSGEIVDDLGELLLTCLLREFDLAHVEGPDTRNSICGMDNGRSFSLCTRQHNINEIRCGRDLLDLFEVVNDHVGD